TFVKIIEILKPTHCIFIGVAASNTFNPAMNAMNKKHIGIEWVEKVGNTFGRKGVVLDGKISADIVFVKHTGKFFSWLNWHNFLLKNCAAPIDYLKSIAEN
ncbi:MAG: hypothetical protein L6407_01520, partial [Candidatus Delongbacteria bacterium]|nr:hypothetical protein [Candidatus Delongbacteria bacterium]